MRALAVVALLGHAALAGPPTAAAVLAKYECHRCHEVEGLAPPAAPQHCAGCHVDLASAAGDPARLKAGHAEYGPVFERFVQRTATLYVDVPPLVRLERFRASWLRAYLENPYDLRPHLAESMPRLRLAEADLAALTRGLAKDVPHPPATAAALTRGEALFGEKGCGACHLLGNRALPGQPAALRTFSRPPAQRVLAQAIDLRHARDRLNRQVIVKTLLDPRSVNPRAQMPRLGLTKPEAEALADFVLGADPQPAAPPAPPASAAARDGGVTYEEVEARVFKRVCWHCHSNADFADGEGGPGNTGGFGFPPLGLSFATYEEVMNGALGPDGEYRSIFRPGASGQPVLLEVLKKRHLENARDFVKPGEDPRATLLAPKDDSVRGMPLGLPAMAAEDIALVEAWLRAGRPRPSTPAGSTLTPMGR